MTSDSEFSSSDYESVQSVDDLRLQRSIATKIRHISYECLSSALSLFDKRVVFGFWSSFIQGSAAGSLLWAIQREPSSRVKASALNFLHRLLMTGNPYVMTLAEESSVKSSKYMSFIPLSQLLAQMIAEIHKEMHPIMLEERNIPVLIQTFKCLSLLVTISPYKKLQKGLLVDIFSKSLRQLRHKEIQIQNSCLALVVKIFELEPFPEELKQYFETNGGVLSLNTVFNYCCDAIMNKQSILLCSESLKLLTTTLKQKSIIEYLLKCDKICLNVDQLMKVSIKCLENDTFVANLVVQSLVCKFLFAFGTVLKNKITSESVETQRSWWSKILDSWLIDGGLQCSDASIPQSTQCLIIDLISTIGPEIFDSFEPILKFRLISVLISILRNDSISDDISCHSAAIRCLGVYQSFPSMTEDLNYLFDVSQLGIDILNSFTASYYSKKSSHLLLYQSSWTLANFTDILKKSYSESPDISSDFLLQLIQSNLNCFDIEYSNSLQNDNIKTNLVRTLASALYLLLIRHQSQNIADHSALISDVVNRFITTLDKTKSFKLQWNICIAFSYLLANQLFVEICRTISSNANYKLIDSIFDTLLNLMKTSRNHKVQSYAVFAICSTNYYSFADDFFKALWITITSFLIDNYLSVPIAIQNNWFEKFCISLNKLLEVHFNPEFSGDHRIGQSLSDLRHFLTEITLLDNNKKSCDFFKSLVQNIDKYLL